MRSMSGRGESLSTFDQSFRFSRVSSSDAQSVASASELVAIVKASPAWDEVSVFRGDTQYPCFHLAWQAGRGFILHCFEDAESSGDFVVESSTLTAPEVEVNLGGQALERWPRQLFVSERVARGTVEFFLRTGQRDPSQHWVGTGEFRRETIWEGRDQRLAWEAHALASIVGRAPEGGDPGGVQVGSEPVYRHKRPRILQSLLDRPSTRPHAFRTP
jgi:hypothetical protein